MAAKKPKSAGKKKATSKRTAMKKTAGGKVALGKRAAADVPQLFRLNIEVGNLDRADEFYSNLFATLGRRQAGARVYFDAGPVTLQIVDVSSAGIPHPAAKALYFLVKDLDALHERAKSLNALSKELVHGKPGGDVVVRPWGERSFYANSESTRREQPWLHPEGEL